MSYNDPKRKYDSQSSQSDIQEENGGSSMFKITSNPGKEPVRHNPYQESSESDISSLSEDSDNNQQESRVPINKKTIEVGRDSSSEQESEQSSGIDLIQQRIKRLEVDLEAKIDRQKKVQDVKVVNPPRQQFKAPMIGKVKSNIKSNPPLPPHRAVQQAPPPSQPMTQFLEPRYGQQEAQNNNQLNFQENVPFGMKETSKSHVVEEVREQTLPEKHSPKKKVSKKDLHSKQSVSEKPKGSTKPRAKTELNNAQLLTKAYKQMDQMQKVIEQLRHQNHTLKEQMNRSKKKHSCEQVQKLKGLTSGDLKLQKQIETLKAIEILEIKLRKSIAKKTRSNGSSSIQMNPHN